MAEGRIGILEQVERISILFDSTSSLEEQRRLARTLGGISDLHISIFEGENAIIDLKGRNPFDAGLAESAPPKISDLLGSPNRIVEQWFNAEGVPYLYAAWKISGSDSRFLRVGKVDTLEQLFRRMLLTLLGSMAFALLLALIGAWIAAQRVTEPLRSLSETAQRIYDGHYDQPLKVDTRAAEFQDLSASLNGMAVRLQSDITKLQRLISIQNEFLGNVSHEVRNPIFAVSGYLEALASPTLPAELRLRYSDKGIANLERLNTLFGDLVEIAKLEYRKDVLHLEDFKMVEMCEEVLETLNDNATDKNIELILEGSRDLVVKADRNRIRQVVTNLIENAIAYSDHGQIRTKLSVDNNKLVTQISDTGLGISAEHLERIFDRFYRVDPARARKSGGSGLGLSIVKQILHAHGEAVNVESRTGEGTKFWFSLPLKS